MNKLNFYRIKGILSKMKKLVNLFYKIFCKYSAKFNILDSSSEARKEPEVKALIQKIQLHMSCCSTLKMSRAIVNFLNKAKKVRSQRQTTIILVRSYFYFDQQQPLFYCSGAQWQSPFNCSGDQQQPLSIRSGDQQQRLSIC